MPRRACFDGCAQATLRLCRRRSTLAARLTLRPPAKASSGSVREGAREVGRQQGRRAYAVARNSRRTRGGASASGRPPPTDRRPRRTRRDGGSYRGTRVRPVDLEQASIGLASCAKRHAGEARPDYGQDPGRRKSRKQCCRARRGGGLGVAVRGGNTRTVEATRSSAGDDGLLTVPLPCGGSPKIGFQLNFDNCRNSFGRFMTTDEGDVPGTPAISGSAVLPGNCQVPGTDVPRAGHLRCPRRWQRHRLDRALGHLGDPLRSDGHRSRRGSGRSHLWGRHRYVDATVVP